MSSTNELAPLTGPWPAERATGVRAVVLAHESGLVEPSSPTTAPATPQA